MKKENESYYSLDEVIEILIKERRIKYWKNVEIMLCLANEIERLNKILESHGIYE